MSQTFEILDTGTLSVLTQTSDLQQLNTQITRPLSLSPVSVLPSLTTSQTYYINYRVCNDVMYVCHVE